MRVTIVKSDGFVSVDGEGYGGIDLSALPQDFHAMQWYGDQGDIESKDPVTRQMSNTHITSIEGYEWVLTAWQAAKEAAPIVLPNPPIEGGV